MKKLYLQCDCSCEAIEFVYEKEHGEMNISLWVRGCEVYPLSWKERLRWIWNILKTGTPWTDYIILNQEKTKELKDYLNNLEASE